MTRWYGSLTNRLHENATKGQPAPKVGDGATTIHYSDRHACTVIAVEELKDGGWRVKVQRDNAERTDKNGMSDSQDYAYTPNPEGATYTFQCRGKDGRWQECRFNDKTKRWNKVDGCGLRIGERDEHYDFSF